MYIMKKPCLGCGTPSRLTRCLECQSKMDAISPRVRANANARGYDSGWRKIRLQILDRDGWSCGYCGNYLIASDATVDHILPLDRGGTNDPNNLIACCRRCNSRKRNK